MSKSKIVFFSIAITIAISCFMPSIVNANVDGYMQESEKIQKLEENVENNVMTFSAENADTSIYNESGLSNVKSDDVVYSDNLYDYWVACDKDSFTIVKHDIVNNTNEVIYTKTDAKKMATFVRDTDIYVGYIPEYQYDLSSQAQVCNALAILKYDTLSNDISEFGIYNDLKINDTDEYASFVIDSKDRVYIVSDYKDTFVYSKDGESIYRYESNDATIEIKLNGVSPKDNALFFSLCSRLNDSKRNFPSEGIQKLSDGKFVYEDNYTVNNYNAYRDPHWQFLDEEGEYAVNQYGQVAALYYDSPVYVQYVIVTNLGRTLNYSALGNNNVPYMQLGEYMYVVGDKNLIYVLDRDYRRVKKLDLNISQDVNTNKIERITCVDDTLYVRYFVPDANNNMGERRVIVIPDFKSQEEEFKDYYYTTQTTQTHTKTEIAKKYSETVHYDYSNSQYENTPSDSLPYKEGSLKDEVINDTLRRLNFYRWLYGADSIELNSSKMARSQKGAVLLSAIDTLTHTPNKPDDMDMNFYSEAYAGCYMGYDINDTYNANCSKGDRYLYEAIDGYMSDLDNISIQNGKVGHRMNLLLPYATQTSFGLCKNYSVLSVYYNFFSSINDMEEDFYAYPSAGYFPANLFYTQEYWSLNVTRATSLILNAGTRVQFKYNGKTYDAQDLDFERGYMAISFKMPLELIEELGGSGKTMPECKIDVSITAIRNEAGDKLNYNYSVDFFDMEKVVTNAQITKKYLALKKGDVEEIKLNITPITAKPENVTWSSSNKEVAIVDQNGEVTALSDGETVITANVDGIIAQSKVRVGQYLKGDINLDDKVNSEDSAIVIDIYTNRSPSSQELDIADMDEDGRLNSVDAAAILDLYNENQNM